MIETASKTVEQWLIIAALVSAIAVGEAAYLNRLKDILRNMKNQLPQKALTQDNKEKQIHIVKAEWVFRALLAGFWLFSLAAIIAFSMVILSLGPPATLLSPHLIVAVLCAIGWLCLIFVAWQSYSFRDPPRRKAK